MKRFLFIPSVITVGLLSLCFSNQAFAGKKKKEEEAAFKKLASGMEYKMLYDKEGVNAKEGDYVEIHIHTTYEDSLIFDSRTNNLGKPVTFPLNNPRFNGDLAEAIMMMSPGDSMIAVVVSDSLKAAGQKTQPWMRPGGRINYQIYLQAVKTQKQMNQERNASFAAQLAVDDSILQQYFAKNNLKPNKTASGLYYTIVKQGGGAMIKDGQKAVVSYTGKTLNGNVFDSNLDPKFKHVEPYVFPVGRNHVISGWDEGVTLLNKGAKAIFYVPSTLAYSTNSPSADIPANSILMFDIELIDIR